MSYIPVRVGEIMDLKKIIYFGMFILPSLCSADLICEQIDSEPKPVHLSVQIHEQADDWKASIIARTPDSARLLASYSTSRYEVTSRDPRQPDHIWFEDDESTFKLSLGKPSLLKATLPDATSLNFIAMNCEVIP